MKSNTKTSAFIALDGISMPAKVVNKNKIDASFFFTSSEIPKDFEENYITGRITQDSMLNGNINDTPAGAYVLLKKVEVKEEFNGVYGYMIRTNNGNSIFGDLTFSDGNLTIKHRNKAFLKKFGVISMKIAEIESVYQVVKRQF